MLPEIPADIASKTAPRLLGYLFNYGLFGLLSMQVYMFFMSFPNDPMRHKALVSTIYVLEVIQTIVVTVSAFRVFSSGYGDFSNFDHVGLAWLDVPVISGVVALIAQLFYSYRIRILSSSNWVAGVIVVLAIGQFAGSVAAAVILKNADLFSRLLGVQYSISAAIWNGGSAVCDVIIAVCMTYYLTSRVSDNMKSTNTIIRRVIRLVIETGTVTATIAIINLILLVLPSKTSYYLLPSIILAKVYSNSMMAILNSRIMTCPSEGAGAAASCPINGANTRRKHSDFELGEGITVTREQHFYSADGEYIAPGYLESEKKPELV